MEIACSKGERIILHGCVRESLTTNGRVMQHG
jgi:hypothetical protein